jgi:prephenate dehydrogenase
MTSRSDPENQRSRRAEIIGTGLIGGSIGLALRSLGWHVTGSDSDIGRCEQALSLGALDAVGEDLDAEVVFVATPLESVPSVARTVLDDVRRGDPVVTDVAGVKLPVAEALRHERFVGGHPMAGSEQVGVKGADAELFLGATWVLTPAQNTDPACFAHLRSIIASMGAEVVALSPAEHDALVAVVSHVPHLTAATLMNIADRASEEHSVLLRLAAGGFRDMTRVAAGQPTIWPDVCAENSDAIVETLDLLVSELSKIRDKVARRDRAGLLEALDSAATARRALPARAVRPEHLAEIRVPVPDRPGVLSEITALASGLAVNIADLEIAHSTEGDRGVLVLVVDADSAGRLEEALEARGYHATTGRLS